MAKLLKLRRGTTSQHGSFTGAEGEVTVDTDKETLVVHDGSTAGGHPVAAEDLANVSSASIVGRLGTGSVAAAKIANDAIDGTKIADDAVNSEHIAAGAVDLEHMASESVDEDNLKISNAGSNGQFLQKQSGNAGGLTWAAVSQTPEGTAVLSTGESSAGKFLRTDGDNSCSWTTDGGAITNLTAANISSGTLPSGVVTTDVNVTANNTTDETVYPVFVDGATGSQQLESDTGLAYNPSTGILNLAGITASGDVTVTGNLTVNGSTTTISTTNTTVEDNLLELNSGATSNANDAGLLIERGSTGDNAIIAWDESADKFTVGTTTATAGSTGDISITTGTIVANVEGNVTGNVTGSGANLTSLPAAQVSGTLGSCNASNLTNIPAAQVSGTLGSCNASNLTSIPAGQLTGTLPSISGANLTNLPGGGGELSVSTSGSLSVGDRMGFNSSGYAVKLGSIISQNNPPSNVGSGSHGTSSIAPNTHTCMVYMPALGVWVAFCGEWSTHDGKIKIFKYSNGSWTWSNSNQNIPNSSGRAAHMVRMTDTKILYAHTYASNSRIQPYIITLTASSDPTGYTASYSTPASASGAQQFSIGGSTSYSQFWTGSDEHIQISRVSSTKAVIAFQGNVGSQSGASNHTVVGVVEFTNTNLTQWNAGSCAQASSTGGIGQSTRLCKIASNKWAVAMEGDTRCAIRAFSISGTSVSFGTRVVVDENGNGGDYQNIGYDPTSDRVIVSWINSGANSRYIAIYSHSGNYLTKQGSTHTLYNNVGSARMSWCPIGNMGSYWFLSLYGGQGGSNDMQVIRVNSNSITEYSEGNGFSSSNPYMAQQDGGDEYCASGVKFDTASGHILRVYGYSGNNLYHDSFNCGVGTPTHTGYIGCYKSSGTIYVAGGVATGLSGLTPGTAYYTDSTGTLSTDSTSRTLAGVAKTSTTMLVK